MKFQHIAVIAVLAGATSLAGCQSSRQALGMTKITPDEFRVVSKAPLVVPPDFSLRPPAPGQPRPQELQPESAARNALIGRSLSETRSDGEKLLVARAGADKADPLIRFVIDDESGDIAHKDKSFADTVMFWKPGQPRGPQATAAQAAAADNTPAPLDPAAEEARIKTLIGDKSVVIAREHSSKIKIPGL